MKNLLIFALTCSLMFQGHAQTHNIRGDSVMDVVGGSYAGIKPALYPIIGSTNALVPFGFPFVTWTPLAAAAIRFTLTSPPTASTNAGYCQIQIIAPQGTLLTNVTDTIQWDGAWGTLNAASGTNYIDLWWDGYVLTGRQTPNYGVSTLAQITSNQDNYVIDTSANEIRIFSDAARNITGIVGVGDHNQRLFRNRGSFTITLKDSVTSTATNQFKLNADIALLAHQTVLLYYDTVISRWCVVGASGGSNPTTFVGFSDTSANLRGALTDESGTGVALFGTSPTIATPAITGAISFQAGTRQTFAPNATTPGFNVGSVAGDPSSLSDGDIWIDSTGNLLRARINGATVSLGTGAGSGNMVNTGASTAGQIPYYTSTSGTALAPASAITNITVHLGDGTAGAPTLDFQSDNDGTGSGFYRVAANSIGVSLNGANHSTFGAGGLTLASGKAITSGGDVTVTSTSAFRTSSRANWQSPADGNWIGYNNAQSAIATLQWADTNVTKTANYTLVALDVGKTINNTGAAGTVILTLPAAVAGYVFYGDVDAAQTFEFLAVGTDTIRNAGTLGAAAGNIQSNTVGSTIRLACHVAGKWVVDYVNGTWTVN